MNKYKQATPAAYKAAKRLVRKHHPELVKARTRIELLFVTTDADDGNPLRYLGQPAPAVTKLVGQVDRVSCKCDARILIIEEDWDEMKEPERNALLDRQLSFLKVKQKDGLTVLDGNNRPRLELRKPDRIFAWFDDVAERHGDASIEVQQAKALIGTGGAQLYFVGMEPPKKEKKMKALPPASGQVIEMQPVKDGEKVAAK